MRVTSLYSTDRNDCQTSRTLALVHFNLSNVEAVPISHARIVAGASIGETLRSAGYPVTKRHIGAINLAAITRHAVQAHFDLGRQNNDIAAHRYILDIDVAGKRLAYATIVELYHPDYLNLSQLERLIGPFAKTTISTREHDILVDLDSDLRGESCA